MRDGFYARFTFPPRNRRKASAKDDVPAKTITGHVDECDLGRRIAEEGSRISQRDLEPALRKRNKV
jgi:hypothetical protein